MTATKFYGVVAYAITEEVIPGKWKERIVEKQYRGDITRVSRILGDAFAYLNVPNIRCVVWMGSKWKVGSVTVDRPRLVLEIGGEYNGSSGPQA